MPKRQHKGPTDRKNPAADGTRERIISAANKLLSDSGRDAITTRAVAEAAGVQAPVLYRHFEDKEAMLAALAEHGFLAYIAKKRRRSPGTDPVKALQSGWDLHIEFGLTHPELYLLMYTQPKPGIASAARELSFSMLRQHIGKVAAAGRLRVPEEQAVSLFHASATGIVLVLLNTPAGARDMAISHMARESILAVIADTPSPPPKSPATAAAITLLAALNSDSPFSSGELSLLKEWLGRLAK